MEILKNIKVGQKVQYITIPLIIIFFVCTGLAIRAIYNKNIINSAEHQAEVYLGKLSQILDLTRQETGNQLTSGTLKTIRPYFLKPAYFETDYPFLVSKTGKYLIHIVHETQSVPLEIKTLLKAKNLENGALMYTDLVNNIEQERLLTYRFYEPFNAYLCISTSPKEALAHSKSRKSILTIIVVVLIVINYLGIRLIIKPLVGKINRIKDNLKTLSLGIIPEKIPETSHDELGTIIHHLNHYLDSIQSTADFATDIGNHKLDTDYQLLSKDDSLGNALLNLRNSLIANRKEDEKRKKEDEIRTWTNVGLAKFADILRQNNDNLNALGDSIIQNLVDYMEANQGGLFLMKETGDKKVLDLLSSFAYDRKKFIEKTIELGEGLVGQCALEKQPIYLKEIPSNYITITSGLGEATPTSLLLIPLKIEENVFGVIEIASFREFTQHERDFVEKVGVSIASTLSSAQTNIRTQVLLEQSQQQREEMSAQEEEMRQNMEEMQATQEEMSRKQVELEGITNAINRGLAFVTLNDDGLILESNANIINMLDLSKLEFEGRPITEFIEKDQRLEFKQLWDNVLSDEQVESTLHLTGNNAKGIYLQATISPALDETGSIIKIILLGHDVTAAKELELRIKKQADEIAANLQQLQTSQKLEQEQKKEKQDLLHALDQYCLITIMEPSGLITYINNKNVETLGDAKEEIEGKYLQYIDFTAQNQPEVFQRMWDALQEGKLQQRDFTLKVGGRDVWIRENFTPIVDQNNKLIKIINIGFDITDAKELEFKNIALSEEIKKLKHKQ